MVTNNPISPLLCPGTGLCLCRIVQVRYRTKIKILLMTVLTNLSDERAVESLSEKKKRTQHNESRKRMKRIAQVEDRDKATVIETGYDFMRARIVAEYAYPDSKQEFAFAIGSYTDAREALIERGFDMSDVPKTITYDESDLVRTIFDVRIMLLSN